MLFGAALVRRPVLAQTPPGPATNEAAIVGPVQEAVVRALNFDRGDLERLRGARGDFTPEGGREFMKHLDGWLDQRGAPTFSSSFVPSEAPTIVRRSDGVLHVTIPGTLRHRQNGSSTTYRVMVDVRAAGEPMKIEHLKQRMCGGSPAIPCK